MARRCSAPDNRRMEAGFFVSREGAVEGPFEGIDPIVRGVAMGRWDAGAFVWRDLWADWRPIEELQIGRASCRGRV